MFATREPNTETSPQQLFERVNGMVEKGVRFENGKRTEIQFDPKLILKGDFESIKKELKRLGIKEKSLKTLEDLLPLENTQPKKSTVEIEKFRVTRDSSGTFHLEYKTIEKDEALEALKSALKKREIKMEDNHVETIYEKALNVNDQKAEFALPGSDGTDYVVSIQKNNNANSFTITIYNTGINLTELKDLVDKNFDFLIEKYYTDQAFQKNWNSFAEKRPHFVEDLIDTRGNIWRTYQLGWQIPQLIFEAIVAEANRKIEQKEKIKVEDESKTQKIRLNSSIGSILLFKEKDLDKIKNKLMELGVSAGEADKVSLMNETQTSGSPPVKQYKYDSIDIYFPPDVISYHGFYTTLLDKGVCFTIMRNRIEQTYDVFLSYNLYKELSSKSQVQKGKLVFYKQKDGLYVKIPAYKEIEVESAYKKRINQLTVSLLQANRDEFESKLKQGIIFEGSLEEIQKKMDRIAKNARIKQSWVITAIDNMKKLNSSGGPAHGYYDIGNSGFQIKRVRQNGKETFQLIDKNLIGQTPYVLIGKNSEAKRIRGSLLYRIETQNGTFALSFFDKGPLGALSDPHSHAAMVAGVEAVGKGLEEIVSTVWRWQRDAFLLKNITHLYSYWWENEKKEPGPAKFVWDLFAGSFIATNEAYERAKNNPTFDAIEFAAFQRKVKWMDLALNFPIAGSVALAGGKTTIKKIVAKEAAEMVASRALNLTGKRAVFDFGSDAVKNAVLKQEWLVNLFKKYELDMAKKPLPDLIEEFFTKATSEDRELFFKELGKFKWPEASLFVKNVKNNVRDTITDQINSISNKLKRRFVGEAKALDDWVKIVSKHLDVNPEDFASDFFSEFKSEFIKVLRNEGKLPEETIEKITSLLGDLDPYNPSSFKEQFEKLFQRMEELGLADKGLISKLAGRNFQIKAANETAKVILWKRQIRKALEQTEFANYLDDAFSRITKWSDKEDFLKQVKENIQAAVRAQNPWSEELPQIGEVESLFSKIKLGDIGPLELRALGNVQRPKVKPEKIQPSNKVDQLVNKGEKHFMNAVKNLLKYKSPEQVRQAIKESEDFFRSLLNRLESPLKLVKSESAVGNDLEISALESKLKKMLSLRDERILRLIDKEEFEKFLDSWNFSKEAKDILMKDFDQLKSFYTKGVTQSFIDETNEYATHLMKILKKLKEENFDLGKLTKKDLKAVQSEFESFLFCQSTKIQRRILLQELKKAGAELHDLREKLIQQLEHIGEKELAQQLNSKGFLPKLQDELISKLLEINDNDVKRMTNRIIELNREIANKSVVAAELQSAATDLLSAIKNNLVDAVITVGGAYAILSLLYPNYKIGRKTLQYIAQHKYGAVSISLKMLLQNFAEDNNITLNKLLTGQPTGESQQFKVNERGIESTDIRIQWINGKLLNRNSDVHVVYRTVLENIDETKRNNLFSLITGIKYNDLKSPGEILEALADEHSKLYFGAVINGQKNVEIGEMRQYFEGLTSPDKNIINAIYNEFLAFIKSRINLQTKGE